MLLQDGVQAGAMDAESTEVERRVFAVLGMRPEPGGYAVAKFSRSARPFEEWARELTQAGAERFYEQWYFQYGHASIADLAHLTLVAENISIVAAIAVLDEQLVDAQESSTRYQNFARRRYATPPEVAASPLADPYRATCDALFATYTRLHGQLTAAWLERYAPERPPAMGDDEFRRTVRARAFDEARYLLPTSTLTGLGYLLSARTLERQIVRLLSDPLAELRDVGEALRAAATLRPAFNPHAARLADLLAALESEGAAGATPLAAALHETVLDPAPVAPTLVKYTAPSAHLQQAYADLAQAVADWVPPQAPETARGVELIRSSDLALELVATLIYRVTALSYRQALSAAEQLPAAQRGALIEIAHKGRGPHDPPLRETRVGYQLVFDICMDCGAFRDLHRHRNCVQVLQPFTGDHGYDTPPALVEAGLESDYHAAMADARATATALERQQPGLGQYVLPLGYRRRALFKMDAAELAYIAEVRTRPAGHWSYREIAWQMFEAFARDYPTLASYIRVTDPREDRFFER